MMKRGST